MEAVGFVASVGTLIQGAAYIRKTLKVYKNGGNDRKRLLAALDHLQATLNRLQTDSDRARQTGSQEAWLNHLNHLSCKGGTLEGLDAIISEIKSKIESRQGLKGKVIQWTWPFVQEDVDRNVKQIQYLSQNVSLALQHALLLLTSAVHERVTRIDAVTNKRELKAILGWLSPLNFLEQQQLEHSKAVAGTCEWFLSMPEYVAWKKQERQVLYCSAIGGAGKTVLASVATDDLRVQTAGQDAGIFSIYCKHDRPDTYSPDKLSMTILRQLVQLRLGLIPPDIEEMLMHHYYTNDTRPSLEESLAIINAHLPTFSATFIVVDGLDEILDDAARKEVIAFLLNLQGCPSLMITSRPIDTIERIFVQSISDNTGQSSLIDIDRLEDTQSVVEQIGHSSKPFTQFSGEELKVDAGDEDTLCETDPQISCTMCGTAISGLHYVCTQCVKRDCITCTKCFYPGIRCSIGGSSHRIFIDMRVFSLKVNVSANPGAMKIYVNQRIQQSPVLHKFTTLRPDFHTEIEDTVTRTAHKMFLLARLHMDTMSDSELLKFSEVRSALETLPTALYDSYDQTYARVRRHGRSLLRLVAYSYRPLSTREIEHALAILPHVDNIPEGEIIAANTLISECAGLVELDENNEVVFSHYSIASYFADRRETLFENGHDYMASICISYLNLKELRGQPIEGAEEGVLFGKRLDEYPFLDYASVFWARHARESRNDKVLQLAHSLVIHPGCRQALIQNLWFSADGATASWHNRASASPIHLSIFFEYDQLSLNLIEGGGDIHAQDEFGMTPLMWAAQTGNVKMVKMFLQQQVSTMALNKDGENVLFIAISRKNTDVALALIEHSDVDINMCVQKEGQAKLRTALMQAIIKEETEVVEMLLTRDHLLVGLRDFLGLSAIDYAAAAEDPRIIAALVKHPTVEIGCYSGQGRPPLIEAAYCGRLHAAKTLLDAGADVNATETKTNYEGTALMRAADYDHDDIVRELLARGADWSATDTLNRNAAHSAAINGSSRSLKVLLELTEIDINMQDGNGNTPTHDAAGERIGNQALRILLSKGAQIEIVNNKGRTPLEVARAQGNLQNISTIMRYDARTSDLVDGLDHSFSIEYKDMDIFGAARTGNVGAVDRHLALIKHNSILDVDERESWTKSTALHLAAGAGHVAVIEKLLQAGAKINLLNRYGRSPLHNAARKRDFEAVKCLLEHGADVTFVDIWGDSALTASYTTFPIGVLLLEYGAEIPKDHGIQEYLHAAATLGKLKVVRRLVEAGANVQSKDPSGRSPYENAKQAGHVEVAKYLDSIKSSMVMSTSTPSTKSLSPVSPHDEPKILQRDSSTDHSEPNLVTGKLEALPEMQSETRSHTAQQERDRGQGQGQSLSSKSVGNSISQTQSVASSSTSALKTEHYIIAALLVLVCWLLYH